MHSFIRPLILPGCEATYSRKEMAAEGYAQLQAGKLKSHWIYQPRQKCSGVVVYFHGNQETADEWWELGNWLNNEFGWKIVLAEYPGYGLSKAAIPDSENELFAMGSRVIKAVRESRTLAQKPLVVWGRSLGGALAANLASSSTVDGVLLDSTMADAATGWPVPPALIRILNRQFAFESAEALTTSACPVLVSHSRSDKVFDWDHAERLTEAATGPSKLIEVKGDHGAEKHTQRRFVDGLRCLLEAATHFHAARATMNC